MIDLVEILETHCTTLGWEFSYGNNANKNLLENNKDVTLVYFLLDPVTRNITGSEFGGTGAIEFNGSFMVLVQSDLDAVYHNSNATGKYELNIKPLLTKLERLKDLIDCSSYEIVSWQVVDVIDVLDANTDGLVITFKIKQS